MRCDRGDNDMNRNGGSNKANNGKKFKRIINASDLDDMDSDSSNENPFLSFVSSKCFDC